MHKVHRLAHGWQLVVAPDLAPEIVREFVRPAVRAAPGAMAQRVGDCRIVLTARLEGPTGGELSSRWSALGGSLEIVVATAGVSAHDVAIELLVCLGQALWEKTTRAEREAWWMLLGAEIEAGVEGEIDEAALREKRALLASRVSARSLRRFQKYAGASFAGSAAEYVHCLWHDVTIRTGPEHLPAPWLRRRLEMLARWFPANRGYRLFASGAANERE